MNKTKCIALCGLLVALAVVVMLVAYVPYLTFTLPVIAGAILSLVYFEIDAKWALGSYAAASVLALLLCEKEASMMFVAFFGYYPVLKAYIERIPNRILEYIVKFLLFNIATVAAYSVIIYVFGIPMEGLGDFGKYTLYILLASFNLMFLVYDMALTKLYPAYMARLHPRLSKLLK